jgi:peptide/nickel transport system permease protein
VSALPVEVDPSGTIPRGRRLPPLIALSLAILALVFLCALLGSRIAPHDPNAQNLGLGLTTPGPAHPFGTDDVGRDVFSRVIAGARTAILGPIAIALGALVIGNALGLVAGYYGGLVDAAIMRWVDLMYSLPPLLVAIVVVGVLGGGYWRAVILLVVLTAPYDTRLVRGATLEQRPLPYVEAARTLGLGRRTIMVRHIWPNILPLVIANSFLNFAFSLVSLATLSFLSLGVGPGTPDWGRMLAESRQLIFENPAAALAPGGAIVLTAAAMNLIGDWLYEHLSDRGRTR